MSISLNGIVKKLENLNDEAIIELFGSSKVKEAFNRLCRDLTPEGTSSYHDFLGELDMMKEAVTAIYYKLYHKDLSNAAFHFEINLESGYHLGMILCPTLGQVCELIMFIPNKNKLILDGREAKNLPNGDPILDFSDVIDLLGWNKEIERKRSNQLKAQLEFF